MQSKRDPFDEFEAWYQHAQKSDERDPEAMTLATATRDGKPSARIVLYKGVCHGGFLIYTNYQSRKAIEIQENPYAALVIYWAKCYRQIRIEGKIEKIPAEDSARYFHTRPRESQIAAAVSKQSCEIPNRQFLLEKYLEFERRYLGKEIPCPDEWGGFRIVPDRFEFWQGQEHRLHDRVCYRKKAEGWNIVRLAP